jgi:hypothetical protein
MKTLLWLVLLGGSPLCAEAQPAPPLLRVEGFSGGSCVEGFCSRGTTWLFRDGLTVAEDLDESCFFRVTRSRAEPAAVTQLLEDFAELRIGFLQGYCHLGEFLPNSGFVSTYTWFGRSGRSSTFTVANVGPSGLECPDSTRAVLAALRVFSSRPLAEPPTELEIRLPPSSGDRCDLGERPPIPGSEQE